MSAKPPWGERSPAHAVTINKFDPIPTARLLRALRNFRKAPTYPFPGTELYPHARDSIAIPANRRDRASHAPRGPKRLKLIRIRTWIWNIRPSDGFVA